MFTFINITLTISLCEIRAMMQQLVNMALNSQGGRSKGLRLQGLLLKPQEYSLLDEATSALDLESERVVQNALNRVMLDRTTLIVAHRLSSVTNADSISVVHQGKIIEQGSYFYKCDNFHLVPKRKIRKWNTMFLT